MKIEQYLLEKSMTKFASSEPVIDKKIKTKPSKEYIDLLLKAKRDENNAIQYGLDLAKVAPKEDLAIITEIASDENDHDVLYTELLQKYAPYLKK